MIREIKQKKSKFGTIISAVGSDAPVDDIRNLESMGAFSAFVTIHNTGLSGEVKNGISYYKQKTGPKLKTAIGHHVSMIRGDQIFALALPSIHLLEDISKVYEYAEANRMERAYGFFLGDVNHPSLIAFTGPLAEHLFHAIPDSLEMVGDDWLQWVHSWAPKAMMTHRYFNANHLVGVVVPRIVDPVAESYKIEDAPVWTPDVELKPSDFIGEGEHAIDPQTGVVTKVEKKKVGRPKKK